MTTEKGIILKPWEVRAVLNGATQLRRVVKPQPIHTPIGTWLYDHSCNWIGKCSYGTNAEMVVELLQHCPYPIGSRWWVREAWCPWADAMTKDAAEHSMFGEDNLPVGPAVYAADFVDGCPPLDVGGCERWRSPVTMPHDFSRITLEVTSTGAGRVQEITYEDILAMGWDARSSQPMSSGTAGEDALAWAITRWNADNPKYPWPSNPWNWVYGVRRVE